MTDRITIFGYGPTGKATAERLGAQGREIVVAQRNRPADPSEGRRVRRLRRARPRQRAGGGARQRPDRRRDRLSLRGEAVARRVAEGDRQFRRCLRDDRRAHGLRRQSLHVRAADRAAGRDHAACVLRREAGRAVGRDPHLDGGVGAGPRAGRGAAGAGLLRARRALGLSRRHDDRRARQGQGRVLHRLARHPARLRLCAGHRAAP